MSETPPPRRGSVWWVDLDPTRGSEIAKRRPAIVITANELCRIRRTVMVVPISSKPRPRPPLTVAVPSAGPDSVAICDQVRAVDKFRLVRQHGDLTPADLRAVEAALRRVLVL